MARGQDSGPWPRPGDDDDDDDDDWRMTSWSLSRAHARFGFDGDAVFVEDLRSTNGTFVNGALIEHRARIGPGDDVVVGGVIVVVHRLNQGERRPEGYESHDRLADSLRDEIVRARKLNRSVSLLFIAARAEGKHVSTFAADVQKHLRGVDRMASYSKDILEVVLPEYPVAQARTLANVIVEERGDLAIGVVAFPDEGDSVDRMLNSARAALLQARAAGGVFVVESGARIAPVGNDQPLALTAEMRSLFSRIDKVATSTKPVPLLVRGETGSGREVVAQEIHKRSPRAKRPLVTVNCGALAANLIESTLFGHMKGAFTGADKDHKGVFEAADGGTVFLDEIGELPLDAQVKLLRVIEARKVTRLGGTKEIDFDVRVVAATHRDLAAMVADGRFREDLYHRLNVIELLVPPLRERREEIASLARRFIERADESHSIQGLDDDAALALSAYQWPGNVRELRSAMDRAVVLASGVRITLEDLPDAVRRSRSETVVTGVIDVAARSSSSPIPTPRPMRAMPAPPPAGAGYRSQVRALQIRVLLDALARNGGNQIAAAKDLQMPLRTLSHQLKTFGIRRDKTPTGYTVDDTVIPDDDDDA